MLCEAATPELVEEILETGERFVRQSVGTAAFALSRTRTGAVRSPVVRGRVRVPYAAASERDRIMKNLTMIATKETCPVLADSPESRRYNRIKRWLGLADFAIGFGLLVVCSQPAGPERCAIWRSAALRRITPRRFPLRPDADADQQGARNSARLLRLPARAPLQPFQPAAGSWMWDE